jgi:hypothetical protein
VEAEWGICAAELRLDHGTGRGGQEGAPLVEGKESTRYALAAVVGEMTRDVEADTVSMTRGNEENRGSQHT